jgi:hypothetical protein
MRVLVGAAVVILSCGACAAFGTSSSEEEPPPLGPGAPDDAGSKDATGSDAAPPDVDVPFACTGEEAELACTRFDPGDWPGGWATVLDGSLTDPLAVTFATEMSPPGKLGFSGRAHSKAPVGKTFAAYAKKDLNAAVTGMITLQLDVFLEDAGPQGTVLAQVGFAGTAGGLQVRVFMRSGQISVQEFSWEDQSAQLAQHSTGAPRDLRRWTRIVLAVSGEVSTVSLTVDGNQVVDGPLKLRPSGDLAAVTDVSAGIVLAGLEEHAEPSTVFVDHVRLTMGE